MRGKNKQFSMHWFHAFSRIFDRQFRDGVGEDWENSVVPWDPGRVDCGGTESNKYQQGISDLPLTISPLSFSPSFS